MVRHFDNCLGCMACVTACPSGVQYHKLIEDTRAQVERRHRRTPRERALRRMLFATFPHPGRLRASAPLLAAYRRTGLSRIAARTGLLNRLPTLRTFEQLAPDVGAKAAVTKLAEVTPPRAEKRGTVGFLQGCVQRAFFHGVNEATVSVLAAEGFEVHAPRQPRCCGALGLHAGEEGFAIPLAKRTIEELERFDHVIANAAGCGSAMKDYENLFRDDPDWADRARRFGARVRDATEFLAEHEPRAERHPIELRVAYHDACHLAHAQGVRAQPRKLLKTIPGIELVEPDGWEICCGSAGIYNLMKPDAADALGRRKAENLLATEPDAVAAANPGCTLQLVSHLERAGRAMPVLHPMELLWNSIEGGGARGYDGARRGRPRTHRGEVRGDPDPAGARVPGGSSSQVRAPS